MNDNKRTTPKTPENKVCGFNAVMAVLKHRSQDIVKAYCTKEIVPQIKNLLTYLAQERKGYQILTPLELEKVAETFHHEGICIVVKTKKKPLLVDALKNLEMQDSFLILGLDQVGNPHNLGAIVRTAAHFNVKVLLFCEDQLSDTSTVLHRTSQGGTEHVLLYKLKDWIHVINWCENNKVSIITTSGKEGKNLTTTSFPKKCLLIVGSENKGLSPFWKKVNKTSLQIPGSGLMESLNVSVATGIFLSHYYISNK